MNKVMILTVGALALAGTGCMSTAAWRNVPAEKEKNVDWTKKEPGGHWNVKSFEYIDNTKVVRGKKAKEGVSDAAREKSIMGWVKTNSDYRKMFKDNGKDPMIDASIKITVEQGPSPAGVISVLNNVLSCFTLTAWPLVINDQKLYNIEAKYPHSEMTRTIIIERRELFSILPLGLIPVPAWAFRHSRASGVQENVERAHMDFEDYVFRDKVLDFLSLGVYRDELKKLEGKKK